MVNSILGKELISIACLIKPKDTLSKHFRIADSSHFLKKFSIAFFDFIRRSTCLAEKPVLGFGLSL